MKFYLNYNNREDSFLFPVPPAEFEITEGRNISILDINSIGEISLLGKRKLATFTIASFFPYQYYPFCECKKENMMLPYACVEKIKKWKDSNKPLNFVIEDTSINMPVSIETFTYGEKNGTRDVYFTIAFKEYRFINVNTSVQQSAVESKQVVRQGEAEKPQRYIVKSGDNLYLLAKRFYGDGNKWPQIASKNNLKNPDLIYVDQELII